MMQSKTEAPLVAVVVPCFNEEAVVDATASRLTEVLRCLMGEGVIAHGSFLCFVDDGSRDGTWSRIDRLHRNLSHIKGLRLSRNFGHQNALLAGLIKVKDRCECAITIDADLQHDEQAIALFVEKYRAGADLVFGVRKDRCGDPIFKKIASLAFYNLMRVLGGNVVKNHADFRLVGRKALDALAFYGEANLFLRGIFATMGFRVEYVAFDVKDRLAGDSKYSLGKMISLALNGITSFSVVPLRIVSLVGCVLFVVSVGMSGYILYVAIIQQKAVPGWASTVLPLYLLGGVQLLSIGLIGEYLGRVYAEVKGRPRYIVDAEIF